MVKRHIGYFIKQRRKELKPPMSAYRLAKSVGIDKTYLSKIENHGTLPAWNVMYEIAKTLDSVELMMVYLDEKYPEVILILKYLEKFRKQGKATPKMKEIEKGLRQSKRVIKKWFKQDSKNAK